MMMRYVILSILLTSPCRCQISAPRHLRRSSLELQGHAIHLHSDTTNRHNQRADNERKKQRVVLLAGPHKTSSSSEQYNIIRWLDNDTFLPGWSWPAPMIDDKGRCSSKTSHVSERPKIFYTYIGTLNGTGQNKCLRKAYDAQGMTGKNLTQDFEQEFRKSWSKGSNLIIASEAMDFVLSAKYKDNKNILLNRILHGMPWNSYDDTGTRLEGSNDVITVVVHFRAPRVEHLISLWHQCCMDTMSFRNYLTIYVKSRKNALHSLNSLGLAEAFLEADLQVTLLDMSGISSRGYDTSNVVACDVLDADCTVNKTVVGDPTPPSIRNVKDHSHGGTDSQLEQMDQIIKNYDCSFQNIFNHENLTILYAEELTNIFDDCENIVPSERIQTIEVLGERLSQIAQNFDDSELDSRRD